MNHVFPSGIYGEYQTLGNNGSPRLNRIFIDRDDDDEEFIFTSGWSQILVKPQDFHFTNTLSPITNFEYNQCGNKTNGEDHLKALFAVNAGKKLGVGFKFDYLYARGYYQNQSTSHFNYTMWGSYLGNRYQAHLLMSTNHQKQAENGGILDDNYIKHPEMFTDNFSENEIPTVLSNNWNRHDNQHVFFTHRYSLGFTRRVPMTEQEIEAKSLPLLLQRKRQRKKRRRMRKPATGKSSRKNHNKRQRTSPKKNTFLLQVSSIQHSLTITAEHILHTNRLRIITGMISTIWRQTPSTTDTNIHVFATLSESLFSKDSTNMRKPDSKCLRQVN